MSDITINAKVVQKSGIIFCNNKKYTKAIVEDETGKIVLNLWRNQVDQVKEGDIVKIPQAFVHRRGKSMQLSTWKKIERVSSEK